MRLLHHMQRRSPAAAQEPAALPDWQVGPRISFIICRRLDVEIGCMGEHETPQTHRQGRGVRRLNLCT